MNLFNLLPKEIQRKRERSKIILSLGAGIGGLVIGLGSVYIFLTVSIKKYEKIYTQEKESLSSQPQVSELQPLEDEIAKLEIVKKKLEEESVSLQEIRKDYLSFTSILKEISKKAKQRVWLEAISFEKDGRGILIGYSYNINLATEFLMELVNTPYFGETKMDSTEEEVDSKTGKRITKFQIHCTIKK